MKLKIAISKIFIAIVVCAYSAVSANDYSSYNDLLLGTVVVSAMVLFELWTIAGEVRTEPVSSKEQQSNHPSRTSHGGRYAENRVARNAPAHQHYESRKVVHSRKTTHVTHHKTVSINITTGSVNQNFETDNGLIIIKILKERPQASEYVHSSSYHNIVPHYLVPNLRTASRFRDNAVFIFGYILQRFGSSLTYDQYVSLDTVYKAIKWRQVQMYSLLPVLTRIQNQSKAHQFRNVLVALAKRLPFYWSCAATDFVNEIDIGRFDSEAVLTTKREDLNFLADISHNDIKHAGYYTEEDELRSYDEVSRITEMTMGPLFVKLFKSLSEHKLYISQPLFACILRNLPNPEGDSIFNEYIKFVAELAWDEKIPNWNTKLYTPSGKNIYVMITDMTKIICSDADVSLDVKQALWYIRDQFLRSSGNTFSQSAREAYLITERGLDISLLMSIISTKEFCCGDAIRLKAQLIEYIVSHQMIIKDIITGMNKYGYTTPQQLLLAFLARLSTRLPVEEIETRKSVTSLISILLIKRQLCNVLPSSNDRITLWIIFEMINDSEMSWEMKNDVQIIFQDLVQNVTMWKHIQNIDLPSKSDCQSVYICLRKILHNIIFGIKPSSLALDTYKKINKVLLTINTELGETGVTISGNVTVPEDVTPHTERSTTQSQIQEITKATIPTSPTYVPTRGREDVPKPTETPLKTSYHPTTERHIPKTTKTTMKTSSYYTTEGIHGTTKTPSKTSHHPTTERHVPEIIETTLKTSPYYTTETIHETTKTPSKTSHHPTTERHIPEITETTLWTSPHHPTKNADIHVITKTSTKTSLHPATKPHIHHTTTTTETSSKTSHYPTTERHIPKITETTSRTSPHHPTKKPDMRVTTETSSKTSHHPTTERHILKTTKATIKTSSYHPTTERHIPKTIGTTSKTPSLHDHIATLSSYETTGHSTATTAHTPHTYHTTEKPVVNTTQSEFPTMPTTTRIMEQATVSYYTTTESSVESFTKTSTEIAHPEEVGVIPVNPAESIQIVLPGIESSNSSNVITLPSVVCLQEKPSAEQSQHKCDEDIVRITQPLIDTFGENYIEVILGNDWRNRYPTRISLLADLLKKVEYNTKITTNVELLTIIKKYEVAFELVAPQVLLPMIADYQKFDTKVVWTIYNTEDISETSIGSTRPNETGGHVIAFPMVNPGELIRPVNVQHPYTHLFPDLPSDDFYAIKLQPLTTLFETGKVQELLGSSWNPLQYSNRGTLLISVLRTLLTVEKIQTNTQLYNLVNDYLNAVVKPAMDIRLPNTYIQTVIHRVETNLSQKVSIIPATVKPEETIRIEISESGIVSVQTSGKPDTSNSVTLPSLVCLQKASSVDNLPDECDKDLIEITQPLINTFGENYYQVILGDDWQVRYPTKISLFVALLKYAEKNPKVTTQTHLVTTIRKYKVAFSFVSSYIFLPLLADYKKLTTQIVWSTYDSENPSNSNFGSDRPEGLGANVIILPVTNPTLWLQPVDVDYPFAGLIPYLPENDDYARKLRPLQILFMTGKVRQYLGTSWNPAQYPNRGVLFVSVLHILMKQETIKSNPELYHLVQNYIHALEGPAVNVHVPQTYIKQAVYKYYMIKSSGQPQPPQTPQPPITSSGKYTMIKHTHTIVTYRNISLFPQSILPGLSIQVEVPESGIPIITSSKSSHSPNIVTLPSVSCLQSKLSETNPHDKCEKHLVHITQPLIKIFGENYIEVILGNNWSERYTTRLSFLVALLETAETHSKVIEHSEVLELIKRYNIAVRFFVPYVLLPLLADYKDVNGSVLWLTYDSKNPSASNIGPDRPTSTGDNVQIMPLVNTKIWLLPVAVEHSFDNLLPKLPANDVDAKRLEPLITLFESGSIREYLGTNWNPSQYPNRGALFISVLHILLNSETVQSNTQLYQTVQDLLTVVEHSAVYIHIPQSYIDTVRDRNEIVFTIDGSHETINLPSHGNWQWSEKTYYERIYESHQTQKVIIRPIQQLRVDSPLYVYMSQSGIPTIIESPGTQVLQNVVIIPSIICLQKKPNVQSVSDECSRDLIGITKPLIETFGQTYIEVLLGNNWQSRYPTTISFIVALLKHAESSQKTTEHSELFRIIQLYKTVFTFIEWSVILPLIFKSQHLTTEIVWSTINSANPSESTIESIRPDGLGENVIVFPLVNIEILLNPVDVAHPFSHLLPNLPANDPYAIKLQPLSSLFESDRIYELLGSGWNPSQYSNRATLLTSVLHILLQHEEVRSDTQLYELIRNYVRAVEVPTRYTMFSRVEIRVVYKSNHTVEHQKIVKTDPKILSQIIEQELVLPQWVFPGWSIHMTISESGVVSLLDPRNSTIHSPNVVILPSFDCLQDKPRANDNPESRCEKDLMIIAQHLIKIFGKNYIRMILGSDWQDRYPTRISLLVALLTNAERHLKTEEDTEVTTIVRNYKIACEFVASYVLLPMLVDSQHLTTLVVWSTFDTANPSAAYIGTAPPDGLGTNVITLPLANPKLYGVKVNSEHPFLNLLPDLPENDPYAIKLRPLSSLIKSGKIYELLGSSWSASNYPNIGALFISSLRTLVELEVVQSDRQLYYLVSNYLIAMQLPALYSHVSLTYIQSIYQRYNVPWVEDRYVEVVKIPNDIALPPLIFPKKTLEVMMPKSGSVVVQSMMSKNKHSKLVVILPSVDCLQGASSAKGDENADDTCDSILEFRLTEPLIEVFGDDYSDMILGSGWAETNHYPTRISFLAAILRSAVKNKKVVSNAKLFKIVKTYKEALEVAAPYIFLPLLANYQKLTDKIVWLTFNENSPWEAHISRHQQQIMDNQTVTLPLVNPKVWILPVNKHHPFSGFLPDLPPGDPFETKIAPLRSILDFEYLRNLTGYSWEPSQFPNRGALFVTAMHTLLKLGPTKLSHDLNLLVLHYYMAIEIPSLYVHVPRSFTKNAFKTAPGTWSIDLVGLMVALQKVTIIEEQKLWAALEVWLTDVKLLDHLGLSLPSLTTSKSAFLLMIINKALASAEGQLTAEIRLALQTFKGRILTTGAGAGVVGWIWIRRWIATTTIQIVNVFTAVVPIERIPTEERGHYSELLDYFTKNAKLLTTDDFPIYRYHTYGAFLRAYFNYLLYKPQISEEARKNIELVIPYVRYTGPGATPMPETTREPAPASHA